MFMVRSALASGDSSANIRSLWCTGRKGTHLCVILWRENQLLWNDEKGGQEEEEEKIIEEILDSIRRKKKRSDEEEEVIWGRNNLHAFPICTVII